MASCRDIPPTRCTPEMDATLSVLPITEHSAYFFLCRAQHKKKNWLFIGHPDAGDRSAIIYSIVVSCERYGIDPLAYVADMLRRLPALKNTDGIDALLPVNWKAAPLTA